MSDLTKYCQMLFAMTPEERKKYDEEQNAKRVKNWNEYIDFLTDKNFQPDDEIPSFAEFVLIIKQE